MIVRSSPRLTIAGLGQIPAARLEPLALCDEIAMLADRLLAERPTGAAGTLIRALHGRSPAGRACTRCTTGRVPGRCCGKNHEIL
ncbi:hypothetical protein HH212_24290 [Massilia forsythiae]|uniref:Uncharacterized protein n=1 Tax=Massilia forsythiae TaxID=2728020 RepID=A0A7Z2W089_9BURK|nr:hypothetical protein [Massilia forsythiae]QJE02738.1 hypothetical protein HH212_24290 [Massilia forsythiae]